MSLLFLSFINLATATPESKPTVENNNKFISSSEAFGLVHLWTTLYDMDETISSDPAGYGDPEDDMGFKIRRARLGLKGDDGLIQYRLSFGVGSPFDSTFPNLNQNFSLVDAYLRWSPSDSLLVTGGIQKVPVSREAIMGSHDLALAERAVSSIWTVPNRDLGVVLRYHLGSSTSRLRALAGVFNGEDGQGQNIILGDTNNGKLYAGRLEYIVGAANSYKTFGVVKGFNMGVGADFFYDQDIATNHLGVGVDVLMRVSGFHLFAEGRMTQLDPSASDIDEPAVLSSTHRLGYLAQIGYTFSDYEFATRYSSFDDNMDSLNEGDVSELSVGLTYNAAQGNMRFGCGYVLRLENGGATLANDTARLWMNLKL